MERKKTLGGVPGAGKPLCHKMVAFAVAAVALLGTAFGDVDLNTFIHGGSMARPLPSTTSSAEGMLDALDSIAQSRVESALEESFDSWCRSFVETLLNGPFDSFSPGLAISIR